MKVDSDLRMALNAAEKAQVSPDWRARTQINAEALAAFLKTHPALHKKITALVTKKRKAKEASEAASKALEAVILPLGICYDSDTDIRVPDAQAYVDKFNAAGGKIPEEKVAWKASRVIARLVTADPADRQAILAEYGINWN